MMSLVSEEGFLPVKLVGSVKSLKKIQSKSNIQITLFNDKLLLMKKSKIFYIRLISLLFLFVNGFPQNLLFSIHSQEIPISVIATHLYLILCLLITIIYPNLFTCNIRIRVRKLATHLKEGGVCLKACKV